MSKTIIDKQDQKTVDDCVTFLNDSPTPFHAVQNMVDQLQKAGFQRLDEREQWSKLKAGTYYFTRNQSSIIAFVIPPQWKPGNGFTIEAGHTDSPVFHVKPKSKITSSGYLQVGVEKYGGGLWHTWFDRDLSIAGRVLVRDVKNDKQVISRLIKIKRPILRISNLAIHLNRDVANGFTFNEETHTVPVFATEAAARLNEELPKPDDKPKDKPEEKTSVEQEHHTLLLQLIAEELNVSVKDIVDFELCLYDTQAPCIGGGLNEFIYSARLDNLCSCYVILKALLNSQNNLKNESNIRLLACFDNEEVGSQSNRGAASNLLLSTMKRLTGDGNEGAFESAIQKSILISADMAHALHPNYSEKHEARHRPQMNEGLVIKYNTNQRYATTMVSSYHISEISRQLKIPLQKFIVRNDSPCGTTIGPILSANCGLRTIDVGIPQLSMHSIREVCGAKDVVYTVQLLTAFYEQFVGLDKVVKIDNN